MLIPDTSVQISDGEITVFEGKQPLVELNTWLNKFQEACNKLLESEKIEFTMIIWNASRKKEGQHQQKGDY